MATTLYLKDNYTNQNIDFLISNFIREYDISKANISILLSKGFINQEEFNYYASLKNRSVVIGHLLQHNPEMNKALTEGFVEYRKKLFEANNIQDDDILSIKKDAIFVLNKELQHTQFDYVNFLCKNVYTSYYKIGRYEFYYMIDRIKGIETLDVKGMKKSMYLHDGYFNELLKCVFECAELDIQEAIMILTTFLSSYMNREVNDEFYREYNDYSLYRVNYNGFTSYTISELLGINNYDLLDVSYNRKLIEKLLSYYSQMIR